MPLPTKKTVTFENGETRNDVPFGVDTWEEYQKNKELRTRLGMNAPQPVHVKDPEEYGAFDRDIQRAYQGLVGRPAAYLESIVPLGAFFNIGESARDLYGEDFYELNLSDRAQRVQQATAKSVSDSETGKSLLNPNLEQLDQVFDEDGYVTSPETLKGTVLELGTYVGGGIGILKALGRSATKAPKAFREFAKNHNMTAAMTEAVASGAAIDQWISNPNEATAGTAILDALEISDSDLLGVGEFLRGEEDDSALEKRTKMLLGNLPFDLAFGVLAGTLGSGSVLSGNKKLQDLTPEEVGEAAMQGLKKSRREAMPPTKTELTVDAIDPDTGKNAVWKEVDDLSENRQVFSQEGLFKGLWQKFTQSRGYNVLAGQDAFEQAQQAARKFRNRGEHLAGMLNTSINKLLKGGVDEETLDNVYRALTERKKKRVKAFRDKERPELIDFLKQEYNLTTDIAENVIDVRKLVDEMSVAINDFAPNKRIQRIINKNLNNYMRRSYELFENKNYKASQPSMARAQTYFINKFREEDLLEGKTLLSKGKTHVPKTEAQLTEEAANAVGDILTDRKVGRKVFERRQNMPEEIRELMGEVTNPVDALLLTTSKMADFYERSRFLKNMQDIGTKQKWLFTSEPEGLEGLVKLQNTGRKELNGMYTTPKMAKVINNKEISIFGEDKINNPLYKNFLSLKGFANKSATVFSWTTILRNILGGIQFGVVNGLNSFPLGVLSENSARKNLASIKNNALLRGDKDLNELYERYVGLGVINTNVRIGDFRALINEGLEASSVDDIMKRASNKLSRGAESFYLGTDDFFKMNAFSSELNILKRANKGNTVPVEVLEQQAADIIKNTFPNYDRVPPGIKALRNWPLGTFVSFPAEIIRTSYGITKQAASELLSGNGVLATRGAARSAGMYAGVTGFHTLGEMLSDNIGWSDKEKRMAEVLAETPWSKDSTRLFTRDEETGKIYSADTKFLDAYNTVKEPFTAIINELERGELEQADLSERYIDATIKGLRTLTAPFTTEAIFTKAITDVYYAVRDPEGKTSEGKSLYPPESNISERIANSSYHVLSNLIPGTVDSIDRLIGAYDDERNPYTGDARFDSGNEWLALTMGVRLTEFDPKQQLNFAINDYRKANNNLRGVYGNYSDSMGDIVDQYRSRQRERYKLQQELYRKIQATQYFENETDINSLLMESGISRADSFELRNGRFIPQTISLDFIEDLYDKVGDSPRSFVEIRSKLSEVYSSMNRTLLNTPEEEEE